MWRKIDVYFSLTFNCTSYSSFLSSSSFFSEEDGVVELESELELELELEEGVEFPVVLLFVGP